MSQPKSAYTWSPRVCFCLVFFMSGVFVGCFSLCADRPSLSRNQISSAKAEKVRFWSVLIRKIVQETKACQNEAFLRDLLQNWKLTFSKVTAVTEIVPKTKLSCETSFKTGSWHFPKWQQSQRLFPKRNFRARPPSKLDADIFKSNSSHRDRFQNEAFVRDLLQNWKLTCYFSSCQFF